MRTFVLRIDPPAADGRVVATLLRWQPDAAPVEVVSETIPWPPPAPTVDGTPLDLRAPLGAGWTEPKLRAAGQGLRGALLHGGLRRELETLLRLPDPLGGEEPSRLVLELVDPDLGRLPWETLSHDRTWLAAMSTRPLSRGRSCDGSRRLPICERPIRVMVIVGFGPATDATDTHEKAWRAEIAEIREGVVAAGPFVDLRVELAAEDELAEPRTLLERIQAFRPHVLHFIGHGEAPRSGRDGALLIAHKGQPWRWSAEEIRKAVQNVPLRLVYLNACETGTDGDDWNVAEPFRALRVPAVVSVNGRIDSGRAATLGGSFIRALFPDPQSVCAPDIAFAAAREAACGGSSVTADVLMPTLTLQAHPDSIFRLRTTPQRRRLAESYQPMPPCPHFFDRAPERQKLLAELQLHDPDHAGAPVVILSGSRMIGKTALMGVLLRIGANEGFAPAYVNLTGATHIGAIGVLERIAQEIRRAGFIDPAAVDAAFAPFFARRDELVAAAGAAGSGGAGGGAATAVRTSLAHGHSEATIPAVVSAFMDGVRTITQIEPLLIVLDQLREEDSGVEPNEWREHLIENFLLPAIRGQLGATRVVIACRDVDRADLGLTAMPASVVDMQVHGFPTDPRAKRAVLEEWLLRIGGRALVTKRLDAIVACPIFDGAWTPKELEPVRLTYRLGADT